MSIEPLEPRIAPASVLNFTDIDGDHVTVTASSGDITAATHAAGLGVQIESIDATHAPGADLIVTVGKVHGGDGHVNIGEIDAQGVNLGKVVIPGDLGRILAGDDVFGNTALAALKVRSMGRFGTSTGASDLVSDIEGNLGALRVAASFGDSDFAVHNGNIGHVFIRGSLRGGTIFCDSSIGTVWIGGDLAGDANGGGIILVTDTIRSVHIGGSIRGTTWDSASITIERFHQQAATIIFVGGSIIGGGDFSSGVDVPGSGTITVMGSIFGGPGYYSASLGIDGPIDVRGSIIGRSGFGSAEIVGTAIHIGGDLIGGPGGESGELLANGPVSIGGSLRGGSGNGSGTIQGNDLIEVQIGNDLMGGSGLLSGGIAAVGGSLGSIAIGGSIIRGGDQQNVFSDEKLHHGTIYALDSIGSITVGGDIIGGDDDFSSAIIARFGSIGSIEVGGSIVAGDAAFSASISAGTTLNSLVVHGNVIGSADFPAVIRSLGTEGVGFPFADSVPTPAHIGSITIDGNITDGLMTAGLRNNINSIPKDARIDSVTVGGDWTASNLIAGVSDGGDGRFGNGDDALIPGGKQSRIGSIAIGGNVIGTGHSSGGSAFESREIGAFSLGGSALELNDGGGNDSLSYALEGGGRLILREVR